MVPCFNPMLKIKATIPCSNTMPQHHATVAAPIPWYTALPMIHTHSKLPIPQSHALFPSSKPCWTSHTTIPCPLPSSNAMLRCNGIIACYYPRLYLLARIPCFSPCSKTQANRTMHSYFSMVLCMHCVILFFVHCCVKNLCTDAIIDAFLGYSSLKRQHILWLSA